MCDTDFDNEGKKKSKYSISEIKKRVRSPKVTRYDQVTTKFDYKESKNHKS